MRRRPQNSITSILTHLGAAVFILAVAFIVSSVARNVSGPEGQLAQSGGSTLTAGTLQTDTTRTFVQPSTLSSATGTSGIFPSAQTTNTLSTGGIVEFLVAVPAESFCENGENHKVVGFLVAPPEGGAFSLTRVGDSVSRTVNSTALALPNGTYRWSALPKEGFSVGGSSSGEFVISGTCSGTTVNPTNAIMDIVGTDPGSAPVSTTTEPAPLPAVLPRAFMNDTLIESGGTGKGIIELRITSTDSTRVEFIDISSRERLSLGYAEIDDMLSNGTQDVWTYFWDSSKFPNRTYSIIARTVQSDGEVLETLPLRITLSNDNVLPNPISRVEPPLAGLTTSSAPVKDTIAKAVAPSGCGSPAECEEYCRSSGARRELCEQYVGKSISLADVSEPPQILEGAPAPQADSQTPFDRYIFERAGARAYLDTDGDGISDFDEINLYRTNPKAFDTDGDGAPDGAELLARTNPAGNALAPDGTTVGEDVRIDDPRTTEAPLSDTLSVSSIAVIATSTDADGSVRAARIAFSGYALPNSFVTIFIFSDPIVATVKTDASGAWVYTLDRELPDGAHEVVTAVVDAGGKIVAKSKPLPFVKQAAAVSIGNEPIIVRNEATTRSVFNSSSLIAFLAVVLGIFGLAVSVIGFTVKRHHAVEGFRHTSA